MVKETKLIRVYTKEAESLERRGFYGESIADILERELTLSNYWKAQEQEKDIDKEISKKLNEEPTKKEKGIKTPRGDVNKMIQWKMG